MGTRTTHATGRRTTAITAATIALLLLGLLPGWAAGPYVPTVLNGEVASIDDLPSVVYLEVDESACTGSVVADRWVLTAAHCFEGLPAAATVRVWVDLDDIGLATDDVAVGASRYVLHPDWSDADQIGTDVALIELASAVATVPITLAEAAATDPVGSTAIVAGWGSTTVDADDQDTGGGERLLRADVPVASDATCGTFYGSDYDNDDQYVCAGGGTSDACQGDSGGPLMVQEAGQLVQIGATAWGTSCSVASGTLGAYTAVSFVRSWIDQTIGTSSDDGSTDDGEDTSADGPFSDVPADHPHAAGITYVSDEGITGGCGGGNYCPTTKVTRAQMATFLANALGLTASGDPDFDDVPDGHVHAAGIAAVAAEGITTGCGGGNFCPTARVSRAQMATFLANALGLTASGDPDFGDVPAGHVHAAGIAAVAEAGITTGCGDGNFCPTTQVSRAQMATFLKNALGQ